MMTPNVISSVPRLKTVLTGPLYEVESHLLKHQRDIESWFRHQWLKTPPPFYASVDLRNAGFKLSPVDTNLFPAGFNNLNRDFLPLCIHAIQSAIERVCPTADKILLIPENHSRNLFYFESVATLIEIIEMAGFEVKVASIDQYENEVKKIDLPSGRTISIESIDKNNDRISTVDGFDPCMVLLNNDLSGGCPPFLENIKQAVIPPMCLGWSHRLKSGHFQHYKNVAQEFSALVNIDPWLIDPLFENCGELNFLKREGEDCLADFVNTMILKIKEKYKTYHIDKKPYVIIKADAGTYGMGVMTAHSGSDIYDLNRKQRTKMTSSKEGKKITKVIIQEGVYTAESWENSTAEPVVYMIDHYVVGGFYRVHSGRSSNENLNAPGMRFEPLAFDKPGICPDPTCGPDEKPNRFYAYGVIARLALIAAAREIAEQQQKQG